MSRIASFFKSLHVQKDTEDVAQTAPESESNAPMPTQTMESPSTFPRSSSALTTPIVSNTPEQRYVDTLTTAVEEANLPGHDFFEYIDLVKGFIEEDKKPAADAYRDAFSSLKRLSGKQDPITVAKLLGTIDHYVKVVEDTEETFCKEADNDVVLKETETNNQLADIEQDAIKQLTRVKTLDEAEKIIANAKEQNGGLIQKLHQALDDERNRQNIRKQKMKVAAHHVIQVINSHKENMTRYVREAQTASQTTGGSK